MSISIGYNKDLKFLIGISDTSDMQIEWPEVFLEG